MTANDHEPESGESERGMELWRKMKYLHGCFGADKVSHQADGDKFVLTWHAEIDVDSINVPDDYSLNTESERSATAPEPEDTDR